MSWYLNFNSKTTKVTSEYALDWWKLQNETITRKLILRLNWVLTKMHKTENEPCPLKKKIYKIQKSISKLSPCLNENLIWEKKKNQIIYKTMCVCSNDTFSSIKKYFQCLYWCTVPTRTQASHSTIQSNKSLTLKILCASSPPRHLSSHGWPVAFY